jgi:hypothetical protein
MPVVVGQNKNNTQRSKSPESPPSAAAEGNELVNSLYKSAFVFRGRVFSNNQRQIAPTKTCTRLGTFA